MNRYQVVEHLYDLSKDDLVDELLKLIENNPDVKRYYDLKFNETFRSQCIKKVKSLGKSYLRRNSLSNFKEYTDYFTDLSKSLDVKVELLDLGLDIVRSRVDEMYSEFDRRERSYDELIVITQMTLDCVETEEEMIKAGFIMENVTETVLNVCDYDCYEYFSEIVCSYIDYEVIDNARK